MGHVSWAQSRTTRSALRMAKIQNVLDFSGHVDYYYHLIAGWSSLVARRAHNPKVRGSNPLPATKTQFRLASMQAFFYSKVLLTE